MIVATQIWREVENCIDLEHAMGGLTDAQRQALCLWLQGYTQEEIGGRLGIAREAARDRVTRAIGAIREILN